MDTSLLLWINQGWAAPWLDPLFLLVSQRTGFALPLLGLLLVLCLARFRRDGLWLWLLLLLVIGLGDLSGNLIKHLTDQPRPCFELAELVRQPGHPAGLACGGNLEAMPSNHALNFFAMATFMWLTLRRRGLGLALFAIATLVGISRIYLGKHYPSQALAGAVLGSALAYGAVLLGQRFLPFMRRIRTGQTEH